MKIHAVRLKEGQDLKNEILEVIASRNISAGCIISSVGSLSHVALRLSNVKDRLIKKENLEILSLNGTLAKNGVHLHMMVSDKEGHCWGGHLIEGNTIHTTCELIIAELSEHDFIRELDSATGFKELFIKTKPT